MFVGRALGGLCALMLFLGLPEAASAGGVGFFEAHFGEFITDQGFGVADDLAAAELFEVPIVQRAETSSAVTSGVSAATARLFTFDAFDEGFDLLFEDLDVGAGTVTVVYSGVTLLGAPMREPGEKVYLFFATSEIGGVYDSREVGIEVDDILLSTTNGGLDYFYPAFLLENGVNDTFSIDVTLENGFEFEGDSPIVPDFVVGGAYVIPEPGSAALLSLGLAGLSLLSGRRYSA